MILNIFICLFKIHMSSLLTYLFTSFAHFFCVLDCLPIVGFWEFFIFWGAVTNVSFANIPPIVFFIFFPVSFTEQKILFSIKSNLPNFSFYKLCYCCWIFSLPNRELHRFSSTTDPETIRHPYFKKKKPKLWYTSHTKIKINMYCRSKCKR